MIADEEGTSNSTTAANNASGTTVLSNASYTAAINNALGAALTDSGTYAVEIDNGTDANSSTTESEPTKLFVSNISSDLCIVTRPDGVQYEVCLNLPFHLDISQSTSGLLVQLRALLWV